MHGEELLSSIMPIEYRHQKPAFIIMIQMTKIYDNIWLKYFLLRALRKYFNRPNTLTQILQLINYQKIMFNFLIIY